MSITQMLFSMLIATFDILGPHLIDSSLIFKKIHDFHWKLKKSPFHYLKNVCNEIIFFLQNLKFESFSRIRNEIIEMTVLSEFQVPIIAITIIEENIH